VLAFDVVRRPCSDSDMLRRLINCRIIIIIFTIIKGHSRSLKVVSFKSLGTVSYSPSIVTMAVSAAILEIFSVKEWPDIEMWIWGPSRSLKMVRFDRPCITSY